MNTLYSIIYVLPLSLLSVMLFGTYAGIPERSIFGYVLCLLFTVWIILLRDMKTKNRLRSIGIVAVFIFGLGIAAGEERRELFIGEYHWGVWVLCFSAAAFAAGLFMERFVWVKRAAAAALFGYCVTGTILNRGISKEIFALTCFLLLVLAAEEIQRRWKKSGSPGIKEHITRTAPFFLIACLAVYLIPAPDKPYGWQFAKNIYYTTVSQINRIYGWITHPSDDYGTIGFSDNGSFHSGLNETDEEVLAITSDRTNVRELRLVGCVSGDFRGREWIFDTKSNDAGPLRTIDTIETAGAARKYAGSNDPDYIIGMEMHYETLFYNTKYIFSPAKIRFGSTKERIGNIYERNGSVISDKKLRYKDDYSVSCYVLNYGNPHLGEWLDSASPLSEDEWQRSASIEGAADRADCSYESYQRYRSEVYERYCRPCGASEQVGEILGKIQSGSSGRYETMKRLEAYLGTLEYSTDCGALPDSVTDGSSFLDHFLFASRKGYCMHFATAFVLMANEMGIPCRYVQGYNTQREADGSIIVRQSSAHAWPEVYFDNAGWIAFEPTPGYHVSAGWEVKEKREEDPYQYDFDPAVIGEPSELPEEPVEEPDGVSPLIIIIPSLAVLSFLLVFYVVGIRLSKGKYKRMSGFEKYRYLTQQNLRFLGYLGCPMNSGETLTEYLNRVMSTDREDIKAHLGFIPVYETALYSDKEITGQDIGRAEKTHRDLRELVKHSRLKYRLMLMFSAR